MKEWTVDCDDSAGSPTFRGERYKEYRPAKVTIAETENILRSMLHNDEHPSFGSCMPRDAPQEL